MGLWPETKVMHSGSIDGANGGIVILNPVSGDGDHPAHVRKLARDRGFAVRETEEAGDAMRFAREAAASGAELVAAAGGDGTVNEVICGLVEAGAADRVTLAVVPVGTGNSFATNIGIEHIDHAFERIDDGETRTVDLGVANDRVFVNSCVGGLTAEASAETTSEAKSRLGVLAYVLNTLRLAADFEGLGLYIETSEAGERVWSGEAALVLIGNGRRFPAQGGSQANMEDGLLDVTIVEDRPAIDLVGAAAIGRLLDAETATITRLETPGLVLTAIEDEPVTYSLDGEILSARRLDVEVRPRSLRLRVGETYEPSPTP